MFPRALLLIAVSLVACGRIDFVPRTDSSGDSVAVDAMPATSRTWVKRTPAMSPPRLNGITLVPYRGSIVFYGGEDMPDTPQSIMWSYAQGTWTQLCAPCACRVPGAFRKWIARRQRMQS